MKKILLLIFTLMIVVLAATFFIRRNPQKGQIEVAAPEAVAQIAGSSMYLTQDGTAIEGSYQNLVQIYLSSPSQIAAGQKVSDSAVQKAAKIAALVAKSDFHAASIRILDSGDLALYDQEETVVIFAEGKDEEEQVDTLQQVMARAKMNSGIIGKIDLRFEKPVITYK